MPKMQKPSTEDEQWTMITPIVTDSIRYLVELTDELLRDNNRLASFESEIQQKFLGLDENTTETLMELNEEGSRTSELTLSNSSKIEHIYSICNMAEERLNKAEQRLESRMTELSSGLYETLATRTNDMMKAIDAKEQEFSNEIAKNVEISKQNQKITEDKLATQNQLTETMQKRIDELNNFVEKQFAEVLKEKEEADICNAKEFESKEHSLRKLERLVDDGNSDLELLKEEFSRFLNHTESHNSDMELEIQAINGEIKPLIEMPQEMSQFAKSLSELTEKVEDLRENEIPSFSAQNEEEHIMMAIRNELEEEDELNLMESRVLASIKEYEAAVKSDISEDELEEMKTQLMQDIIEEGFIDNQLVNDVLQNMNNFTENDKRIIATGSAAAETTINAINCISDFNPNGDENLQLEHNAEKELQFVTNMRSTKKEVEELEKVVSDFHDDSCDLHGPHLEPGTPGTRNISGNGGKVKKHLELAKNLLRENQGLELEYAEEEEIIAEQSEELSHGSGMESPESSIREMRQSQQLNEGKNAQLEIIELKERMDEMQMKHDEEIAELRKYIITTIEESVAQQMSNCGLADFLQLDSKLDDAPKESLDENRDASLFTELKYPVGERGKDRRRGSVNQKILNSPVGSQSLQCFPKMEELNESCVSYRDDSCDTPPVAPLPDQSERSGSRTGLLNKNFLNSQIYLELRTELYKNAATDNELLFERYMKEISRIDRLIDLENEEIVNVEERLRKYIKSENGVGFRRTATELAPSTNRGVEINIQKPVMLIGYTGEDK